MNAAAVAERLGLADTYRSWLEGLQTLGAPPVPVGLPTASEAGALLRDLGVAQEDAAEVAATLPAADRDPEIWWLLERGCHRLLRHMGECDAHVEWPALPAALGAHARLFNVYAFLAVLPEVRRWHREHAVPEAVSQETFRSLGRAMTIHRLRNGEAGVFEQNWMTLPFRACLYELGRLQYTPLHLRTGASGPRHWYDAEAAERLGPGFRQGDATVGIHIPEAGPLTPEGCDASLRRARELFSRPLPFGPCRIAICGSWLLDEQLAEYLPATSNIIRFQRRFTLMPGHGDGDGSVFNFVFHRSAPESLDDLPQRTTLERAVVAHLRGGRHWRTRTGWLEL